MRDEGKVKMKFSDLPELTASYLNFLLSVGSCSLHTTRAYAKDLEQAFNLIELGHLGLTQSEIPVYSFFYQGPATSFPPESDTKPPASGTASALQQCEELDAASLLRGVREALSKWSGLSPASRNRKSACLKSFSRWLFEQDIIDTDLAPQIFSPKVPIRLPHFLSIDEALALIKSTDSWVQAADSELEYQKRMQSHVLILLLYGGGLRISEACGARWRDLQGHTLRVLGKGGHERLIALPELVIRAVRLCARTGDFLFGEKPMDSRKAYGLVRAAGVRANLVTPLHPHALRHSYATHLLADGTNLRILQELLGHRTLQATQRYTHLSLDQLARMMETNHPLAGNKGVILKRTSDE